MLCSTVRDITSLAKEAQGNGIHDAASYLVKEKDKTDGASNYVWNPFGPSRHINHFVRVGDLLRLIRSWEERRPWQHYCSPSHEQWAHALVHTAK
jgi:hypothetical protein